MKPVVAPGERLGRGFATDAPQHADGQLDRFADARVVVIDDDPARAAALIALLRGRGLQNVHGITDALTALDLVAEIDPGLVLLDLQMSGVDGYELLAGLRERAGGSYLPVLVLTGDRRHDAINRALDLGARDFVTEPVDPDEITLRIRNLLETKELHTTLRHHNVALRAELGDLERVTGYRMDNRETVQARVDAVLRDRDLEMVFQPIVQMPGERVVGCEALARFHQLPQQGPERWFAEAERVGRGTELEMLAATTALDRLRDLPPSMFMSVNVSASTALAPELHHLLEDVDGERVVLELTEHVPVEDYAAVSAGLSDLRQRGVRLASDDTGAGYAGFRHLLGLSPDIIKLDISLARDIDQDPVRRALAGALVAFARDVDARVIAEGVETKGELETLEALNVPWLQGFHLGRPGGLDDVAELALP